MKPITMRKRDVRAILEGRKTQTRRKIISPFKDEDGKPSKGPFEYVETSNGFAGCFDVRGDGYDHDGNRMVFSCPYGAVGGRLWVQEPFGEMPTDDGGFIVYKESAGEAMAEELRELKRSWRSASSMPQWASRITLRIEAIRGERLQNISLDDIKAEGCPNNLLDEYTSPEAWFIEYWNQNNVNSPWSSNPPVWVIEFRRAEK